MEEFYTRDFQESARKLALFNPSTKEPTEHYLEYVGYYSGHYQNYLLDFQRKAMDSGSEMMSDRSKYKAEICAGYVTGWSFDKDCTPENVAEFLLNAPQVCTSLDIAASQLLENSAKK